MLVFETKTVIISFLFYTQEDKKTLMKISLSEMWNTHRTLCYFKSKAIVLYVALLITRRVSSQNEKGSCRELKKKKKEEEMTPDKPKHRKKQSYLPCTFNAPL